MTEAINKLTGVRNGNRVKRYHTIDLIVQETVGHHSSNVAMLCVLLSRGRPRAELLIAALTHDLEEQFTGDIPATAKWYSPALCAALNDMEDAHALFHTDLMAEECRILKQADMLDLCFKCREEIKMGNEAMVTVLSRGIASLLANDPLPATQDILKEHFNVSSK